MTAFLFERVAWWLAILFLVHTAAHGIWQLCCPRLAQASSRQKGRLLLDRTKK